MAGLPRTSRRKSFFKPRPDPLGAALNHGAVTLLCTECVECFSVVENKFLVQDIICPYCGELTHVTRA